MTFTLAARLLLYVQLILGILQSPGVMNDVTGILHTHRTLAFIVPAVVFWAFRPRADAPSSALRLAARYGPLAPLALGLVNWVGFKMLGALPLGAYFALMGIHMLLGIGTVALVEIAAGRERRARAASA